MKTLKEKLRAEQLNNLQRISSMIKRGDREGILPIQ